MEHTVQIVEPNQLRGKHIASQLIQAGYDAQISSSTRTALRQFFQVGPDAVIFGDGLPVHELRWLGSRIRILSDLPLIGLGDHVPPSLVTRRLTASTAARELLNTLQGLLEPTVDVSTLGRPLSGTGARPAASDHNAIEKIQGVRNSF